MVAVKEVEVDVMKVVVKSGGFLSFGEMKSAVVIVVVVVGKEVVEVVVMVTGVWNEECVVVMLV